MRTARSGRDVTRRRLPVATVVPRLGEEGDGGACHLLQLENVAGADGGVSLGDEPLALRKKRCAVVAGAAGSGAEAALWPSKLGDLRALVALDDV